MHEADLLAGAHRCLYGTTESHCGAPATVHVLMDEDGTPTMSCAEHASWWDTHTHRDRHPVMAVCGMPGTTWMYATLSADGYTSGFCAVEALESPALVEHAAADCR